MIVGMFLGLKLFCNMIFRQPWTIEFLNLSSKMNKKFNSVIILYTSYFYTVFTTFYKKVPLHSTRYVQDLKKKGV